MKRSLLVASAAIVLACSARAPRSAGKMPAPVRITILGVNDFHGAIEPRTLLLKTSANTTAEVRVGGASLLASYLKRMRELNADGTVLLSAGDMWQGSLESNYFEGRAVVMLDDAIGYDAAALGNHEFDYGPVGPVAVAEPGDSPAVRYGALLARRKEARFPILSANAKPQAEGVPSFPATTLLERKGVRIGIVGLSTEDTPNTTQAANVVGLAFEPPAPALIAAAADLRARGADVVVATAHIGGECARGSNPEDASSCKPGEEIMRMLAAVPPGTVDAIVAGHTHQFMANRINGVPVIESGAYGLAIGRIELDVDRLAHKVVHSEIFAPQPVCRDVLADTGTCAPPKPGEHPRPRIEQATFLGGPIEPDPEIEAMLAPFRQEVAEMKATVLATAERPIGVARSEPSEMGVLVCEELRRATLRLEDVPDADFAVQNSGGLRTSLPKGEITYGKLYEVLPFDNVIATFSATGEQLESLFTQVARTGRIFQTDGLTQELSGEGEKSSVKLFDLATGKRLVPKKTYTVVWSDFLAAGGDGTKDALPGVEQKTHQKYSLRDVVAEGLKARKGPVNSAKEPLLDPKKVRLRRK